MGKIDFFDGKTIVNDKNFPEAMAQAIGIEIATIPVYLYTYYSINRVPDQAAIIQDLQERLMARGGDKDLSWEDAREKAQQWSARIMVFANFAGASIVSVAIEEMLHLSLSCNVHQATLGPPTLVGIAPTAWPAYLAGHEPAFPINRRGFSLDQLYTFLQIESPHQFRPDESAAESKALKYDTIGDFYQGIIDYLGDPNTSIDYNTGRPQLAPGNGYYAQNNINTNYYNKAHKPRFVNADDSGDLIFVDGCDAAQSALREICKQGEGAKTAQGFGDDNLPVCKKVTSADFDDPAEKELAHFAKFNRLWCRLKHLEARMRKMLNDDNFDVKKYFVYNVPENPSTTDYPPDIQAVSNLLNAVYAYVFLMSESCYRVDKPVQYEVFMAGIHKTMMWILGSLCETIVTMTYTDKDGTVRNAAPTFEEYAFNAASSPKSQIQALCATMLAENPDMRTNACKRIDSLPDIPLNAQPDPSTTIFV